MLLEARTQRWHGHFEGDRQLYRPEGEVAALPELYDPLVLQSDRLLELGIASEAELDAIERRVAEEVAEAVLFGRNSPESAPEDALLHVYSTDGRGGAA